MILHVHFIDNEALQ